MTTPTKRARKRGYNADHVVPKGYRSVRAISVDTSELEPHGHITPDEAAYIRFAWSDIRAEQLALARFLERPLSVIRGVAAGDPRRSVEYAEARRTPRKRSSLDESTTVPA